MDLSTINELLGSKSAADRLVWIGNEFPGTAVFSTSLGQEDQVITHLIARQQLPIRIFTLDTGRLFQETYDLLDKTRIRYKVNIEAFFPDLARLQPMLTEKGPNSFYESVENRKECCFIRKVEPLNRALKGAKVWITGLRADQSENRSYLPFAEWDAAHELIKIHPLLDWTYEELQQFIRTENVPYNILHDKGFPSIGCAPCTRAVEPGEDIRAGRWWWEVSKKECGLHQETAIKLK